MDFHGDSDARDRSPCLGEDGDGTLIVAKYPLAPAQVDDVLEGSQGGDCGHHSVLGVSAQCVAASSASFSVF